MAREEELMNRAASVVLLVLVSSLTAEGAEHHALLPRPQKVQYGKESFPLRGLTIRFGSTPSVDDRFAAQELSKLLSARAGAPVRIANGSPSARAIVLVRTGAVDPLPVPDERPGPDSREAYSIKVSPGGAEIRARSSAGVYYGVQTLRQMVEGSGDRAALPEVEVHDWPSLAYRGTMVDMSHGPLPTEEEVKRQIDFLARWKDNQYYFYNEVSIELEGCPLLNPEGRFTKDQVRRIIAYGRERHVDVIPCLELYGHLHDLFRVEKYSDLGAFPHGGEFNPSNPKVKALLADWVDQFSSLFPSPFVHIGFDETWQIEKAAKQQGAGATPARLFVEQLNIVARLFQQRGKRVMAWADIIVKYPEMIPDLPRGLIAVAWHYDPEEDYKPWLGTLVERGMPKMVATGANDWEEIVPDYERAFANIDTFLGAGRQANTLGLINTVWTDDAQVLLRMSWPAMAYGAVASWQSAPVERAQYFSDYARLMYPAAVAEEIAAALGKLAKAELALQKVMNQETMLGLWGDPFAPATLKRSVEHREDLRQTRLLAEEAQERLHSALAKGADPTTLSSLVLGARLLDYAALKFIYAVEINELWQQLGPRPTRNQLWYELEAEVFYQDHGRIADLMDTITDLRPAYESAWHAEYAPYRLGTALGRWAAEYEYWRRLQARYYELTKTYRDGETLPPLESLTSSH